MRIERTISILACMVFLASCGPSDGSHRDHYPNGKVKEQGAYKDGEKVGEWTYYWKTGVKKTEGKYAKGKPDRDLPVRTDCGLSPLKWGT
jgi:hypothetical protein